ncbi:MAG: ACT domain-containing protein [Clostridiales bacterium]|nr:ACT domain-containing protein [Clostridiales bacterium]
MENVSRAIVTVMGRDRKGIIARVSDVVYRHNVNILDIAQTVMDGYFNMTMLVDITAPDCRFSELSDDLNRLGEELGVQIRAQKSEIFDAMYRV